MTRQAVTAARWKMRLRFLSAVLLTVNKTARYELWALESGYRTACYNEWRTNV